ncbi:AraC family transcriptional regulator [Roseivirga sp. 4D4]|uniref:helix-turn-helix domain-containing protein n=1 Tax=Roseivirga sp. 4D4 TaxID=1889784 RepID=UPI000853A776|nr:AraC family transcriptional regulator [Roseivirga sp. 4D4]OEK03909.1 AraC family transcriptional regulator [Roseivirga sp. 4D4]
MSKNLHIKNMVCQRCIMTVESDLKSLGIPYTEVHLGQVNLKAPLTINEKNLLVERLVKQGFELLEEGNSSLIDKVKTVIIDMIHHRQELPRINYSEYISEQVHKDYSYLSKLFSSVEGITIEKFIIKQKIEKVKELLSYGEKAFKEIAFDLDYSSVQHLSNQFKKETGMTPSQFKQMSRPERKPLDSL